MRIIQQWFETHQRDSTWDQIGHAAAVALAFAIPVSTAVTNILAIVILVAWILGPHQDEKWQILRYHPLLQWIYPLILIACVGALYSHADPKALRHGLTDALRFVIIPLLFYFYQSKTIAKAALWAFVAAMVLTLVLSFLKVYADFPIGLKFTMGAVFKSHIKTSYFMAMAAFFLALQLPTLPRYRWAIGALIAGMIYYLFFMNMGRIGYITIVICAAVLAWQAYRFKGLAIASAVIIAVIIGAYAFSDIFSHRLHSLTQDFNIYQQGGDLRHSSLGSRLSFAFDSIALMKDHPVMGYGTGSFGAAYATLPTDASRLFTDNPHNEFLRMGVEFGGIGVLLLMLFFYQQWHLGNQLSQADRQMWHGIFLTFIIGCCVNSWLKDFTEAYFYCVMTAICFSQLPLKTAAVKRQWVYH